MQDGQTRRRDAVARWSRQWWSRAVVQVAPAARRRLEASLLGEVYAPLLAPSGRAQLAAVGRLVLGRYLATTLRRRELRLATTGSSGQIFEGLTTLRDNRLARAFVGLSLARSLGRSSGDEIRAAAHAERANTHPTDDVDLGSAAELAPAGARLLRSLLVRPDMVAPALDAALREAEILCFLALDVDEVQSGAPPAAANAYAALAHVDPEHAAATLRAVVDRHLTSWEEHLHMLDEEQAAQLRRRVEPMLQPLRQPLLEPPPGSPAPSLEGVSGAVVLFGMLCVLGWLVAYAGIIHRGFADQTFGVPLPALAANICWEFAYGFLLDPLVDYFHTSSIFGFAVDLVIVAQAYAYGADQFHGTWLHERFALFLSGCLALALPVVYFGFLDLGDPDGEYTGFGINLMMSMLYLAMLSRRGSGEGQSLYIALGKWFGTFCAWMATALTVTTTPTQTWPSGWRAFLKTSLTHRTYPLTPLVNVMYGWTFVLDAAYTVQLHQRLRADGFSPWRRF